MDRSRVTTTPLQHTNKNITIVTLPRITPTALLPVALAYSELSLCKLRGDGLGSGGIEAPPRSDADRSDSECMSATGVAALP